MSTAFQFQYGAIGSVRDLVKSVTFIPFQFQYGAIGRSSLRIINRKHRLFQFQYGAIGSYPGGLKKGHSR